MNESAFSAALQREMVWLSAQVPYEQAQTIAERIGGWHVAVGTVWQQTQRHGQRLLKATEQARQHASLETTQWNNQSYAPGARKAVSMDGGMVHVRKEGWKELKVGLVGDFAHDEHVHLSHMRYCGLLGDVGAFEAALWRLAVEQAIPYAGTVVVTADGAPWIWRLADNYFPCAAQVVDWYHATQHLAQPLKRVFPMTLWLHSVGPTTSKPIFSKVKSISSTSNLSATTSPTMPIISYNTSVECNMLSFELLASPLAQVLSKVVSNNSNTASPGRECAGLVLLLNA